MVVRIGPYPIDFRVTALSKLLVTIACRNSSNAGRSPSRQLTSEMIAAPRLAPSSGLATLSAYIGSLL